MYTLPYVTPAAKHNLASVLHYLADARDVLRVAYPMSISNWHKVLLGTLQDFNYAITQASRSLLSALGYKATRIQFSPEKSAGYFVSIISC